MTTSDHPPKLILSEKAYICIDELPAISGSIRLHEPRDCSNGIGIPRLISHGMFTADFDLEIENLVPATKTATAVLADGRRVFISEVRRWGELVVDTIMFEWRCASLIQ